MKISKSILLSLSLIFSLMIGFGCNNLPVTTDTGNDSIQEITGISLLRNGIEIVTIKGTSVKGTIEIEKGRNEDIYEIRFQAENNDTISLEGDYWLLDYIMVDDIGDVIISEQLNQFQFYLNGRTANRTKLCFILKQGFKVRERYMSPYVSFTVK